ncbi:MAG: hypothetical protein WBD55_08440 [Dehalococcoidia bacterium]
MTDDLVSRYAARLLIESLNERFGASFDVIDAADDVFIASDGAHRAGIYVAPLWEREEAPAWEERLRALAGRLNPPDGTGAYLLWVPPRADVPFDEPAVSEFVARVEAAASGLAPGQRIEVPFPVTVKMGKMREEGGYASVVGGLSRWWTRITEKVNGTFSVDSSAVHRLTDDGSAREELWETIGRLSLSVGVGQAVDFEIDEAWTLQRLPESDADGVPALSGAEGFALVGGPPSLDPTEGVVVRRMARRRLQAANEALGTLDVELRVVGLIGLYEYAEVETASGTIKAIDPSLYSRFEVVSLFVDGEARPVFLPRALPWA